MLYCGDTVVLELFFCNVTVRTEMYTYCTTHSPLDALPIWGDESHGRCSFAGFQILLLSRSFSISWSSVTARLLSVAMRSSTWIRSLGARISACSALVSASFPAT